jgi:teichuronic acid exporter
MFFSYLRTRFSMLRQLNIKSDFFKSILVLTSGTVMAQVVNYLATPFITRLFTPDEMGELGVFLRITAFITAIATARYELALPLPKNDYHAFQLFRLSLRITLMTLLFSFILGLGYWVWMDFDIHIIWYILLIIAGSFFMIFRNISVNWSIRNQEFKQISISGVLGSSVSNGLKILAGIFKFGVVGLIVSSVIGAAAAIIVFSRNYWKKKRQSEYRRSKKKMLVLSKQYREFPAVNLPHILIDNARELLIAFFVVEFFDQAIFGSYDHSFRMLKLPLVVIGLSIGQVFYNRCSKMFSNKEAVYPLLRKTTLTLTLLSIVPFSIIFFFGEPLFILVFGDQWGYSGEISEIIAPWLMVNFIASPISTIPMVIGKQRLFFWLGLISSIIQLAGFGLLPLLMNNGIINDYQLFWIISLSMTLFLVLVIIIQLRITKTADEKNKSK